jgi:hypothetical protein
MRYAYSFSFTIQYDSLISPLPRLLLARCPRLVRLLRRDWSSLNCLFFLIIGVSLSGKGTSRSVLKSSGSKPKRDMLFLVFLINGSLGGPILD